MTRPGSAASLRRWLAPALGLALACGGVEGGSTPDAAPAPAPAAPAPDAAAARAAFAAAAGAACVTGDAHGRHLNGGLDCSACHPRGARYGFGVPYTYPRGTTSAGGTLLLGTGGTPSTCSVGCHAPLGAPLRPVAWNAPAPLACTACHDVGTLPAAHPAVSAGATRADCTACHDLSSHTSGTVVLAGHGAGWRDPASPGFHAFSADRGLERCKACHGPALDGVAGVPGCGACHDVTLPAGVASWKASCGMCHGQPGGSGAPPAALWGFAGDPRRGGGTADPVRVGAHAAHLAPGRFAGAFPCASCHPVPADALAPGHVDETAAAPLATVTFGGLAVAPGAPAPAWDRPSATCASTYCHGFTVGGGTNPTPVWTGAGQAECGSCHGLPPPPPHLAVTGGPATCAGCHPDTLNPDGTVNVAGGFHLNGKVDASGGGCAGCHGDANRLPAALAPAPPRGSHGELTTAARAVGAHQAHLVAGRLRGPIPCGECHVLPADLAHVDGKVELAFGPLATSGGVTAAFSTTALTCSNYCHGAGFAGGTLTTPAWTRVDGTQAACGTCHGSPPAVLRSGRAHPADLGGITTCWVCHPMNSDGTIDLTTGTHVNGVVDVW